PFLFQFVHRAVILAARGKQPFLALEDDGEIGRQGAAGEPFVHRSHAEHQAPAPPLRVPRAGEAYTQPAAVRPRAAVALDLGVAPVDVEVHRAADAGAQITVATRQTALGAGRGQGRRGDRVGARRGSGKAAGAQQERQASHAWVSVPRRPHAPGTTSSALARRAWPRAIPRAACMSAVTITTPN